MTTTTIQLIGVDDRGEMVVGRAETEAQIARVRELECALADGEALTWDDFDNPAEPRTLFQAIARDRGRRIDQGTYMADRPPFAVVTVHGDRAVRLEFVLENEWRPGSPVEDWLVPAPVRAVLRAGYTVRDGLVWCRLPYSSEVGLLTPPEEDEY